MSKLKFSLAKTGLERVLRHWEAQTLQLFWKLNTPMNTGKIWEEIVRRDIRTKSGRGPVSRASIINFLADMANEGFLDYEEESGKGGYHRVYTPSPCAKNENTLRQEIARRVQEQVEEFLDDVPPFFLPKT